MPPPPRSPKTLVVSLGIAVGLMAAQLVGFWITHSLSIAWEALHMLVDAGAIGVAILAAWLARRPATQKRTFGYHRVEILGALANGATLIGITILLLKEAIERLTERHETPHLAPEYMIVFGLIGLVANSLNALMLHRHAHDHDHAEGEEHDDHGHAHGGHADLNMQGVFLHVLGDVLGSLGAVIAGVVVLKTGWIAADALFAAGMSLIILARDVRLCVRAVDVLLESSPRHVDVAAFEAALRRVAAIREVHDLHVWTLTSGVYAMSCHARVGRGTDHGRVLADLKTVIKDRFGIDHTTIQLEDEASS